MSSAGWISFLDSLESELQAVQRADHETRRVPEFVAPDLGPLPGELAERARTLLAKVQHIEADVRIDLERTQDQLRELRHLDPRAPRPASQLDARF